jgi:hypothetical protein
MVGMGVVTILPVSQIAILTLGTPHHLSFVFLELLGSGISMPEMPQQART